MDKKKYKHKPHFCIFCKTDQKRIYEHILRKHADEERVQEISNTPDKKERFWMWKRLSQEGDKYFNVQCRDELADKRIVKEPNTKSKRKQYYDCPICLGRLRTASKFHHKKVCEASFYKAVEETEDVANYDADVFKGIPEIDINILKTSPCLSKFIHDMRSVTNDKVVRTLVSDLIALDEEIRKIKKCIKPLVLFLTCSEVDNFITCIKNLCIEEKKGNEKVFRYPSKAQRLCRTMGSLCKFLVLYYTKRHLEKNCSDVKKFQRVFEHDSEKFIKKQALRSIKLRKLENPTPLLKTTDISIVTNKLKEDTTRLMEELSAKPNAKNWRLLAENTLCRLTIFNRRRGGAVEKMTVKDYQRTEINSKVALEEALFDLNKEDKKFLEELRVAEIIHKCGNVVPILINKEIQGAMEMLIKMREHGEIHPKNDFMFAASRKSLNPISCGRVLEKYRKVLPPGKREIMTATNLRKHGATAAQILDLTEKDSEEWASHMGHALKVHKQYYRRSEITASVLKTGRILNALDSGTIKFFKGKKVDEIPLNNLEESQRPSTSGETKFS